MEKKCSPEASYARLLEIFVKGRFTECTSEMVAILHNIDILANLFLIYSVFSWLNLFFVIYLKYDIFI